MTARTARAAAAASGWPPKVVAWSPGTKADGHVVAWPSRRRSARRCRAPWPWSRRRARRRGAESRTTRPVRPRPVWTSSTMNSRPRSSHSRRTAWKYSGAGRVARRPRPAPAPAARRRPTGRWPLRGHRCRPRRRGGIRRAGAGTARAWSAGRWRARWPASGRGTSRRR